MLHHYDFALGKLIAKGDVELRLRPAAERTCDRDALDLIAVRAGQAQAFRDGSVRHAAWPQPARDLRFFKGCLKLAVLEDRAGWIAEKST